MANNATGERVRTRGSGASVGREGGRGLRFLAVLLALCTIVGLSVPAGALPGDGGGPGPDPDLPPEEDPVDERDLVVIDWTMPSRFGADSNGDGLIDYMTSSYRCTEDRAESCSEVPKSAPQPIAPETWHVDLNACGSRLASGESPIFTWEVVRGSGTISGGSGCGDFDLTVAAEGVYRLKLTISSSLGTASVTRDVTVQDWLVLSLGDSYGSGEGNPDIDMGRGFAGVKTDDAKWQDRRCHRSAHAGSAQAARWLEIADPRTSVTFIHVACSGAQALEGLLETYAGVGGTWETKHATEPLDPQIAQARELVAGREIDATYISIGGNDANFAKIVMSCIALAPCNPRYVGADDRVHPDWLMVGATCATIGTVVPPPLSLIAVAVCVPALNAILANFAGDTAENHFNSGLRGGATEGDLANYRLTSIYNRLFDALHATGPQQNGDPYLGIPDSQRDRVFISEYVDATQDDEGDYCPKGDVTKLFNDTRIPGLGGEEYEWIDLQVERKLNDVIAYNAGSKGWTLVDGIHAGFATHGICADDTYMVGLLTETLWRQDDINGAAHPNITGHSVYRNRIISKLLPSLYPGAGGETLDIQNLRQVQDWIGGHAARLPAQRPIAEPGGPYSVDEGSTITTTNTSFDDGPMTYAWSTGDDGVATVAPATAQMPLITGVDDGTTTLTLTVTDSDGNVVTATTSVTVTNVAPTVAPVVVPSGPVQAGTSITATSSYADPGADDHTITWSWGDGTTDAVARGVDADGPISADHTYATAGFFTVTVTVDDGDGGVTTQASERIVIYDPSGGFVTGGGIIDSPAGALVADPSAAGNATFSFVAKYQNGQRAPEGNVQFRLHVGELLMRSTSIDWLVVTGNAGYATGEATVNGVAGYGYLLSAVDSATTGKADPDRLRLQVWRLSDGSPVYDNQLAAPDDRTATAPIRGGQISINGRERGLS